MHEFLAKKHLASQIRVIKVIFAFCSLAKYHGRYIRCLLWYNTSKFYLFERRKSGLVCCD